jgi:hypothetical protein
LIYHYTLPFPKAAEPRFFPESIGLRRLDEAAGSREDQHRHLVYYVGHNPALVNYGHVRTNDNFRGTMKATTNEGNATNRICRCSYGVHTNLLSMQIQLLVSPRDHRDYPVSDKHFRIEFACDSKRDHPHEMKNHLARIDDHAVSPHR